MTRLPSLPAGPLSIQMNTKAVSFHFLLFSRPWDQPYIGNITKGLLQCNLSLFCQKCTCNANVAWLKKKQKFKPFLGMWLLVVVSYLWAVIQCDTTETGHLIVPLKTQFACHTLLTQPQPGVCLCPQNNNLTGNFCFQFIPRPSLLWLRQAREEQSFTNSHCRLSQISSYHRYI